MNNQIQSLAVNGNGGVSNFNQQPYAKRTIDGLEIFNVEAGDDIRLDNVDGHLFLSINGKGVDHPRSTIDYNTVHLIGENLTRDRIRVSVPKGTKLTVHLQNQKRQIVDTFKVENNKKEEKNLVDKVVDSGVKVKISPTKFFIEGKVKF